MIDLHVHSSCSDGTDSPSRLVELAASLGVKSFALTDHDTMSGVDEARIAGERLGVEVIAGVELSCHHGTRAVHMLGYFFEAPAAGFDDFLRERRSVRDARNAALIEHLNAEGIEMSLEEVENQAKGEAVGRPHFAAVLVAHNYVETVDEAFEKYLGSKSTFFSARRDLPVDRAIEIIHASGGVASWAHPLMGATNVDDISEDLVVLAGLGLDGLECIYSAYSQHDRRSLALLARNNGLIPTGGSDFHGTFKPGLQIGKGTGDLRIAHSVLDELRSCPK